MPIDGIGCDGAFNVSTATPLLKKVQLYPCYCFAFSPSWFSGFNLFHPLFPYSANANFSSGSTARKAFSLFCKYAVVMGDTFNAPCIALCF